MKKLRGKEFIDKNLTRLKKIVNKISFDNFPAEKDTEINLDGAGFWGPLVKKVKKIFKN